MADIPALVLHHDEPAVLTAVEMALAAGVPTKTHGLNLLRRLADGKKTGGPDIDSRQALTLHNDPKADVDRYDGLRAQIGGGPNWRRPPCVMIPPVLPSSSCCAV